MGKTLIGDGVGLRVRSIPKSLVCVCLGRCLHLGLYYWKVIVRGLEQGIVPEIRNRLGLLGQMFGVIA